MWQHIKLFKGMYPFWYKGLARSLGLAVTMMMTGDNDDDEDNDGGTTGERPFWCEGCSKAFTDAGVLKKHKQRCPYVADDDDFSPSLLSPSSAGE